MYRLPAGLVLLTALAACGGGSGGGASGQGLPTQVAGALQKYEGVWIRPCAAHNRDTMTLAASNGGATLSFTIKTEYFANVDCTGAVVATGTYAQAATVLQYTGTVKDASVRMPNGETVTASVDQGNATATTTPITFTGSGVTSSTVNGKTVWHIQFGQGSTDVQTNLGTGVTSASLALRNGELLVLSVSGNSGNTFNVESRLTH
ncbi:hypothetical protein GJ700_25785 [Duganella sp. FT92W]|uniref:Lipocalin-like domain-containing protein n=1 Tax=Pseudoduganella rivuli TaxID=2666085 RepID=A0A7X2IS91_9BURK|nr:hypothetical protein [Pseudoduganella rivuli]MRV75131.1 hypothetical protein [Pseudoduganella rivuli]